jgi:hypothetical protein
MLGMIRLLNLSDVVPELMVLWEKYVELAEIVLEAVKEGLVVDEELDLEGIRARRDEAMVQSERISKIIYPVQGDEGRVEDRDEK